MAFTSRWKTEGKPNSDIALLKYPFTVTHNDDAIRTLQTPEEAEALLDYLWDNRPADVPRAFIENMAAPLKLRDAVRRKRAVEGEAQAKVSAAETKFQKKADDAKRRRELRAAGEGEAWMVAKRKELAKLRAGLRDLAETIDALPEGETEETYLTLTTIYAKLGQLRAPVYNHHYGVTSSKWYQEFTGQESL